MAVAASLAAGGAEMPDPIHLFDLRPYTAGDLGDPRRCREIWDTCHLVASLQGLANRNGPRLYLRYLPADDYWWSKLKPADPAAAPLSALSRWLADREVHTIATLEELLAAFRDVYRGAVVYDDRVPATSNLASTIAGVEDLLCLRYDETAGSLYDRLVNHGPRLPVAQRLLAAHGGPLFTGRGALPGSDTPSTGSAKADAYLWAKERYLDAGRCSPWTMAYYLDAWWLRSPHTVGPVNHTLTNHDIFVARRAFFFDLGVWDDETPVDDPGQTPGTDARVLAALLRSAYEQRHGEGFAHVGGFVPWASKYTSFGKAGGTHEPVPSEWRYAEILSCHNAYMDADALGLCAMANASFTQHFPLAERYPQPHTTTGEALRQRGLVDDSGAVKRAHYVAFYVGDYDSAAWLYQQTAQVWDNPDRGKLPLSWAFNPNLAERMAPALVYCRETATPNDSFVAGDSGAGYLNPGHLQEPRQFSGLPSGVDAWRRHCEPYYQRWDLAVTGFVIDGFAPPMGQAALDAYAAFSPGGIVGQKVAHQTLHREMPVLRMASDLGDSEKGAAEIVASRLRGRVPQFLAFRSILKTPTWHLRVVEGVRERCPREPVEVVDMVTLLALVRQHELHHAGLPLPGDWPADEVSYAPGAVDRGLWPVVVNDGPFTLTETAGVQAMHTAAGRRGRYLYFELDDRFLRNRRTAVDIRVEFLDRGSGSFVLEYDADDAEAPHAGAYKPAAGVTLTDSGAWRSWTWLVPDARFGGNQNNGSDLRLAVAPETELLVRRVVVRRQRP
jgi:hypothetical protein